MLRLPATIPAAAALASKPRIRAMLVTTIWMAKLTAQTSARMAAKRNGVYVSAGPTADISPMTTIAMAIADCPSID